MFVKLFEGFGTRQGRWRQRWTLCLRRPRFSAKVALPPLAPRFANAFSPCPQADHTGWRASPADFYRSFYIVFPGCQLCEIL